MAVVVPWQYVCSKALCLWVCGLAAYIQPCRVWSGDNKHHPVVIPMKYFYLLVLNNVKGKG